MRQILKYKIPVTQNEFVVFIPRGGRIVEFAWQGCKKQLCIWAECDEGQPPVSRRFRLFETGMIIAGDPCVVVYRGTALIHGGGEEVVHLYEIRVS